ncbi:MAG: M23 family metallopeptidase [Caldilineaceae bacterium]
MAADDGEVLRVGFEEKGFGNYLILRHRWGETIYAHLNRIDVATGAVVQRGQAIGLTGNTGASTGAHLHFGVRITPYRRNDGWGGFCDPRPFWRFRRPMVVRQRILLRRWGRRRLRTMFSAASRQHCLPRMQDVCDRRPCLIL